MIHFFFACYSLVTLAAVVLLSAVVALWKIKKEIFNRHLVIFMACAVADVLICCAYYYILPNVISLNPLDKGIGVDIAYRSMPFFALLTIQLAIAPFSFYLIFMMISEAYERNEGVRLISVLAGMAALWLFASNWSVPLVFKYDERAIRAICSINRFLMTALQALAVGGLLLYGKRIMTSREGNKARLCRSLLISLAVLVLLSFADWAIQASPDSLIPESAKNSLYFAMNRSLALCLIVSFPVFRYIRAGFSEAKNVLPGQAPLTAGIQPAFIEAYRLTPRETEIANMVLEGWANKDISKKLDISYHTVKNHIANLFAKIGIQNRFELILATRDFVRRPGASQGAKV